MRPLETGRLQLWRLSVAIFLAIGALPLYITFCTIKFLCRQRLFTEQPLSGLLGLAIAKRFCLEFYASPIVLQSNALPPTVPIKAVLPHTALPQAGLCFSSSLFFATTRLAAIFIASTGRECHKYFAGY
ncbi:hypothetical protein [uncultured Bartonella sp.]|uniref:hypothetical protein n=1 Tax=uncultured Bartonella sp. TaxID=104108 RepID=UPI0026081DAC|nr:hypothetical protein [uncultured Bartonella sp.]